MPPVSRSQAAGSDGSLSAADLRDLAYWAEVHELRAIDIAAAPGGAVNASKLVIGGGANRLVGWAITETTGAAAAAVRLHDGGLATDRVMSGRIALAQGAMSIVTLEHGLRVQTGMIFLEVVAGSVEGVLWVR